MLCDLLWGRWIRSFATREFEMALVIEEQGALPAEVTEFLDRAAHWEWMAARSEQGQILWGERYDRQGRRPEDGDRGGGDGTGRVVSGR